MVVEEVVPAAVLVVEVVECEASAATPSLLPDRCALSVVVEVAVPAAVLVEVVLVCEASAVTPSLLPERWALSVVVAVAVPAGVVVVTPFECEASAVTPSLLPVKSRGDSFAGDTGVRRLCGCDADLTPGQSLLRAGRF